MRTVFAIGEHATSREKFAHGELFAHSLTTECEGAGNIGAMTNRIRERRKERKMSMQSLADAIGCSKSYLSQVETGSQNKRPSIDMLRDIASVLGTTVADLAELPGQIPVVGKVSAGGGVDLVDGYTQGDGLDWVPATSDMDARRFVAVRIEGDSMEPNYPNGGVVIYRREFEGVHQDAIGGLAIVETVDGEAFFKKLVKGRAKGEFDLISLNSTTPNLYGVRLKWAAPMTRFTIR